mgnify:CR=1 FL=1
MGSVKLSSGMDVPNQALILPIKKSVYLKNPSIPKFKTTELAKIHFADVCLCTFAPKHRTQNSKL